MHKEQSHRLIKYFSFLLLFLMFAWSNRALANDESPDNTTLAESETTPVLFPDAVIADIRFDGLKRTKEEYVKSELRQYIGRRIKDIDIHEIETELQKIGLFDSVVVSIQQDTKESASLNISLIEKWSLIPIPMLAYIDEWMGGLFLMDMNAFGENDKFTIGGMGSKSRVRGVMAFSTPSLIGKPGLSFSGSGAKDKVIVYDMSNDKVLEYKSINYVISGKVNYKFSIRTSVDFGLSYNFSDNDVTDAYTDFDAGQRNMDVRMISLKGKYNYEIANWNGWFLSKTQITVDAELGLNQSDMVTPSVMLTLRYQQPIFWDQFRFISHAAGYYSYHSIVPLYKKGRAVGSDILPNRFVSPIMVAAGAGFEVGVYRFSLASFSIGGQYQVFYGQDWDSSFAFHHGWSCAIHANMSRVAVPAFSLGLAQDVVTRELKYNIGLGMSL